MGTTTKLHCKRTGFETADVTWCKNGRNLAASKHYLISTDGDTCLLTIDNTCLYHEGEYSCHLTHDSYRVLSQCVLMVHEVLPDANTRNTSPPVSTSVNLSLPHYFNDQADSAGLRATHTEGLSRVNDQLSSFLNADRGRKRPVHRGGFRSTHSESSSSSTIEDVVIRRREKPLHAPSRKHKPSRKNNQRAKHNSDSNVHAYTKHSIPQSDSSEDSLNQVRPIRNHRGKVLHQRSWSLQSSYPDGDLDSFERVMALSEKADACLNMVNSVLEMSSFDKEVDEALQEQIDAFRADVSDSEGQQVLDNRVDQLVDNDTEMDFIKQMAAQKVASVIAVQMMREANSLHFSPPLLGSVPMTNGFTSTPRDFTNSFLEVGTQDIPKCSTAIELRTEESGRLDSRFTDVTAGISPCTSFFRGPEDKIFTLDEILDTLPESFVDSNSNHSSRAPSPTDKMTKFTLIEPHTHTERQKESPAKLLSQLQDIVVLDGDALRLEVQGTGYPIPEVTWKRDGKKLHTSKIVQLRFDGEHTWSVIIRHIKSSHGGLYTCTLSNTTGSSSTSAVVTVADTADENTDDDEEITEKELSLTPTHTISSASPTSLTNDDVFIEDDRVIAIKDSLPLILLNAEETNIDDVTPQSNTGTVDLHQLTSSDMLHLDRNANWAEDASPSVSRSNSNNSEKGCNSRLPKRNRPESNIETIRHRKAFRKNISRGDSTTSIEPCSTGNSASESDNEGAPKFTRPLKTTEVLEGETVQFEVVVTGEPDMRVRWFHDGTEIRDTNHSKCYGAGCDNVWQLSISKVRPEDDGRYVCRAENNIGVKNCVAFLIVETLNATEGTATDDDDDDKNIVTKLMREREDADFSQFEKDVLKSFTVESDYSDSSGRMSVKKGDQVELLDERCTDRWLVRHKSNPTMIGYIPSKRTCSLSEEEGNKMIYKFVSKQNYDSRASMQEKIRVNRNVSFKDYLSELEEGRIIEDSFDLFMAIASYSPPSDLEGFIAMAENQVFEVLDSNSALNWLVRIEGSSSCNAGKDIGWVPASYLTPYIISGHGSIRRSSLNLEEETKDAEAENQEDTQKQIGGKEEEAMIKRGYVLKELLDTERDFVKSLKYVTTHFIPPINHPNVRSDLKGKKEGIFCNIEEIYEFHKNHFLHELEECENDANSIARAFIKWQSTFINLHVLYCKNKPKADTLLTAAAKEFFLIYGGGTGPGQLGLGDYLIKPVQRVTKYQLLLKEIVKYTSRAKEDCSELEFALNVMIEVPKRANDLMHLNLIEGFQRDVTELGKLYRQDLFSAWSGKPKGRGKERYIFLFKDILLLTKPKKELKGDVVGYVYKSHLKVCSLSISEDQSDERRFELSQNRSSLSLLASTKYKKEAWVKALQDLIAEIPKDVREAKSASERHTDYSPIITRKRRARSMLSSRDTLPSTLLEPGSLGSLSKSTESLNSPPQLILPQSGRGSIDSMMCSAEFHALSTVSSSTNNQLVPSIGAMYKVLEDMVADGYEAVELLRGDTVKLIGVCDNNLFHIQTMPTDELVPVRDGYVPPGGVGKIFVEEPPVFTETAKPRTLNTEETAIFSCTFTGKPAPTATWSFSSLLDAMDKRLEFVEVEDASTLILYNVSLLDAGEFTCTVENTAGSTSCKAILDVKGCDDTPSDVHLKDIDDHYSTFPIFPLPVLQSTLVRSSSAENLKSLDDDFEVMPNEIHRASSVSGRGMLMARKKAGSVDLSTKDKIGNFRKHFKKAFSQVGMERDKLFHNLQRPSSAASLQRSKHQQKSTSCIHCNVAREETGNDALAICEACTKMALAGSRETLIEEDEDPLTR